MPSHDDLHVRLKSNGNYWLADWTDSTGHRRGKGLGSKDKLSERAAKVKCRELEAEMRTQHGRRDQGKVPTLGDFLKDYMDNRTDLSAGTRELFEQTIRYLIGRKDDDTGAWRASHFSTEIRLDKITHDEADRWRAKLAKGELAHVNDRNHGKPSEQTVCLHSRNVKTMFERARRNKLIMVNPFEYLKGNEKAPEKNWHDVSESDLDKLIEASPNEGWKLAFALWRLAGLRQDEALTLQWQDVDFEKRTIVVNARIEKITTKKKRRMVPIVPKLHDRLKSAYMDSDTAGDLVVPAGSITLVNIWRDFQVIAKRAGLTPWGKWCHTLRKNRETDWGKEFPGYVVAAWMGHDEVVSRDHYLKVTPDLYSRASGVQAPAQAQPATTPTNG